MKIRILEFKRLLAIAGVSLFLGLYVSCCSTQTRGWLAFAVSSFALFAKWGWDLLAENNTNNFLPKKAEKSDFDWGMHYFRGLAIISIMVGHVVQAFEYKSLHLAVFRNATIYFLFISGYLCQYINGRGKKFRTLPFFVKKIKNVISPYVLCSIVIIGLVLLMDSPRAWTFNPFGVGPKKILKMFVYGQAQGPYWFIPFMTILFLVSPLLLKLKQRCLLLLLMMSIVPMSIMAQRPVSFSLEWPRPFLQFLFFFPSYALGFVYARHKDEVDEFMKGTWPVLLCMAVGIALYIYRPGTIGLRLTNVELASNFQKIIVLLLILQPLQYLRSRFIPVLDLLAKYSFAMFFVHAFFISDFLRIRHALMGVVNLYLLDAMLCVAFVAWSFVVSVVLKAAIGRHSRSVIGA